MSFGFSISDFLTLGTLTLKLYLAFKAAPSEFSQLSRDLHSFHIVIADLSSQAEDENSSLNKHGTARRLEMMELCNNLVATMEELQDLQKRYQRMGRISWSRFTFGQQNLESLRSKLHIQITAVNSFVSSLNMGALSRMEPMMERIYWHLDERAKGNIDKAETVLTAKVEGTDNEAAWAILELDLRAEGFPQQYILDNREQIKEVLASVVESNHLEGTDECEDSIYADDSVSQADRNQQPLMRSSRLSSLSGAPLVDGLEFSTLEIAMVQPPTSAWLKGLSHQQEAARFRLMNHGFGIEVFDVLKSKEPTKLPTTPPIPVIVTQTMKKSRAFFRPQSKHAAHSDVSGARSLTPPVRLTLGSERSGVVREKAAKRLLKNNAVCWAVSKVDITALRLLLERGCDPSSSNAEGSVIVVAAAARKWDIVDLLVKAGANIKDPFTPIPAPSSTSTSSQNPWQLVVFKARGLLHVAAEANNLEILELLLKTKEIDVDNIQEDCGYTALHFAASVDNCEAVSYILGKGANVDALTKDAQTALHLAVHQMNQQVEKNLKNGIETTEISKSLLLFLNYGADVNSRDISSGATPLFSAISARNIGAAEVLLKRGANLKITTNHGHTSLEQAVLLPSIELVKILLKNGAPVDMKGSTQATPLQNAVDQGNIEIAKALIDAGASVDKTGPGRVTLLRKAIQLQNIELVQMLLQHGADINAKGSDGIGPLQIAFRLRNLELVEVLVGADEDIDFGGLKHRFLLLDCIELKGTGMVERLLKGGAHVNCKEDNGITPLFAAVQYKRMDLVEIFLASGADINQEATRQRTALHEAVLVGNVAIVDKLLKAGANMEIYDDNGRSPLFEAIASKNVKMVEILLERGAKIDASPYHDSTLGWTLKERPWYLVPRRILRLLVWKGATLRYLDPSDKALCEMWREEPYERWNN